MENTVRGLGKRCIELGILTEDEFLRCIPSNFDPRDVEGAIGLLSSRKWSGGSQWYPELTMLSEHQVSDLKVNDGVNLRCGNWVVVEKLGSGGMGSVFLVRDLRTDSLAALKIENKSNPDVERFTQEFSTLARLRHSGLPTYREPGKWDGNPKSAFYGQRFYVMEYVDGTPLSEIAEPTIDYGLAISLMKQVAECLAYCHQRSILHRDIKLSNMIIESATDRVVVLDLGLCKSLRQSFVNSMPNGTPLNMAPEQASAGTVLTFSLDVYGFGCAFFELLTGRPVFPASNLSYVQLMRKHKDEVPPTVQSLRSDCPNWLSNMIDHCLVKDPGQRYSDGAALLSAFLGGPDTIVLRASSFPTHRERGQVAFDTFAMWAWRGIQLLEIQSNSGQISAGLRLLDSAFRSFEQAVFTSARPSAANLIQIHNFLPPVHSLLKREWPSQFLAPIRDNLGKIYCSILVYLADWLTDSFVSEQIECRSELVKLQSEVADALRCWADAVRGLAPYRSSLDSVLQRSLHAPYSTPLPRVLYEFSLDLLNTFNDAIHSRMRDSSDNAYEQSLSEFVADQAVPYWEARSTLPALDPASAAQAAGESLYDLLHTLRPDQHRILTAVPNAIRALRLATGDEMQIEIQKAWCERLKARMATRLRELREEGVANRRFGDKLAAVMPHLRPAVDGKARRTDRFSRDEILDFSRLSCELYRIGDPERTLACTLIDISIDALGIGLIVPIRNPRDLAEPAVEIEKFYLDHDVAIEVPIRFTAETPLSGLKDCVLRLTTAKGVAIELIGLEQIWWERVPREADLAARVGLEIRHCHCGDIKAFAKSCHGAHGIVINPHERLLNINPPA